ncbi:hypothetical protein CVT26_015398 [Gymnopilus dilepis]|uniref:Uncharacterized protein n=1 Tax=Gymnopilus dilepis TaxID=231916 RepID=A0A409WA81_9AGAR|nr:hypothetical protein CVT26_015398 [Gymnopilus dilepis]
MLFLNLLLLMWPTSSFAISWLSRASITKHESTREPQQTLSIEGLLDEDDYNSLKLNLGGNRCIYIPHLLEKLVLKPYSHKPDCFKRAAALIRNRCTELDMDEDSRWRLRSIILFLLNVSLTPLNERIYPAVDPYLPRVKGSALSKFIFGMPYDTPSKLYPAPLLEVLNSGLATLDIFEKFLNCVMHSDVGTTLVCIPFSFSFFSPLVNFKKNDTRPFSFYFLCEFHKKINVT